jgi:hypothetical protein
VLDVLGAGERDQLRDLLARLVLGTAVVAER